MGYYMNYRQAFEILGIEVTTERKKIKGAYSELVRMYHPEECPNEWRRIHDAYECAMQYAQRGPEVSKIQMPELSREELIKTPTPEPFEQDFSNLSDIAKEEREKRQQKLAVALFNAVEELERLALQSKRRGGYAKQWKKFFASSDVQSVRMNNTFLYRLGDVLSKIRIDYYTYMVIKQFLEDIHPDIIGDIFSEEKNSTNLEAWQTASNGAYRALTGNEIYGNFQKQDKVVDLIGSLILKILKYVAVILLVCIIVRNIAGANYKIESGGVSVPTESKTETKEIEIQINETTADALICVELNEESNTPCINENSILPERSCWWMIKEMPVPKEVEELALIEGESEVVSSFVIAFIMEADYTVDVVFPLEEFDLEEGRYKVWQYDGEQYHQMKIHLADEWNDGANAIYPYEENGLLYLNTDLYVIGVYKEAYPVVITRMNK